MNQNRLMKSVIWLVLIPALLLGISVTGIVLNFLIDLLDKWCCLKILSEKAVRLFADRCNCCKNR